MKIDDDLFDIENEDNLEKCNECGDGIEKVNKCKICIYKLK